MQANLQNSFPILYIRTLTVGFGISPNLLTLMSIDTRRSRAHVALTYTAGGEFHPTPRTLLHLNAAGA